LEETWARFRSEVDFQRPFRCKHGSRRWFDHLPRCSRLIGLRWSLYLLKRKISTIHNKPAPGALLSRWLDQVTKLFQLYVARYSRYDATYLATGIDHYLLSG